MRKFIGSLSIKNKIYLGVFSLLAALLIVGGISFTSLNVALDGFRTYKSESEKVIQTLNVDESVTDLQRNILFYTYTGHESLILSTNKTIDLVLREISNASALMNSDEERQIVERMNINLERYKETFASVVQEREFREELVKSFDRKAEAINSLLKSKGLSIERQKVAFVVGLSQKNIYRYLQDLDYKLIEVSVKSLDQLLVNKIVRDNKEIKALVKDLRSYALQISQSTRSYLYFVSVVMAREVNEFSYLSEKLRALIVKKAEPIGKKVEKTVGLSQKITISLVLLFAFAGGLFSWGIARNVSVSLTMITNTFMKLSEGNEDLEIPGGRRKDEIGILSKAANVFREKNRESRQLVKKLDTSQKQLQQSNEELSQFAYRTSHDLKAPLISINGLAKVISEDVDDGDLEEVKENALKISQNASKLENLVMDILNLSRADVSVKNHEEINFDEVIKEIMDRLDWLFEENQAKLLVEINHMNSFYSQRTRLTQVVENLISNAVKYSDSEKSEKYVKISTVDRKNNIEIQIEDNGLGIPLEHQGKVFKMFERFHPQVTFGSGLGMSIVKKHIDRMDGEITFESSSEGTRFTILLPNKSA